VSKKTGGLLFAAIVFGAVGWAGLHTAVVEGDPQNPMYGMGLLLLIPLFIFILVYKQGNAFKKQQAKAKQDVDAFISYLEELRNKTDGLRSAAP
jgi:hypothetical protein